MNKTPDSSSGPSKTPLSSSLRERLKRCGRYHSASPPCRLPSSPTPRLASPQTLSHGENSLPAVLSSTLASGSMVLSPRQLQVARTPTQVDQDDLKQQSALPEDETSIRSPCSQVPVPGCDQVENTLGSLKAMGHSQLSTPVSARQGRQPARGKRLSLWPGGVGVSDSQVLQTQQADRTEMEVDSPPASAVTEAARSRGVAAVSVLDPKSPSPPCRLPQCQHPGSSSQKSQTPSLPPSKPQAYGAQDVDETGEPLEKLSSLSGQQSVMSENENERDISSRLRFVQAELAQQTEVLRKLRLVKMYRSKNDLEQLQRLIAKWRQASQQALQDLCDSLSDPRPSMSDLLQHLSVPHSLIQFNPEDDEFT